MYSYLGKMTFKTQSICCVTPVKIHCESLHSGQRDDQALVAHHFSLFALLTEANSLMRKRFQTVYIIPFQYKNDSKSYRTGRCLCICILAIS